jgi:hypothetical protein
MEQGIKDEAYEECDQDDGDAEIMACNGFVKINEDVEDGAIKYRLIEVNHKWETREVIVSLSVFRKTFFAESAACGPKIIKKSNPFCGTARKAVFACRRQKFLRAALFTEEVPITTPRRFVPREFRLALTEK